MLSVEMIEQLRIQSEQLAVSASVNMDAPVEHCPGWTVRDLVVHIGEVQRFWVRIVSERLTARPTDGPRGLPEGAEPIEWFRAQTTALALVFAACADDVLMWTWWEPEQHAGWVKRRQLNEVAVHAWDAANAVGMARPIPTEVAIEGLQEFVDVFAGDLREGVTPPPVALVATDCDWSAVLFRGGSPGDVHDVPDVPDVPDAPDAPVGETVLPSLELRGTASDLLLSVWSRLRVDPAIAAALNAIDRD